MRLAAWSWLSVSFALFFATSVVGARLWLLSLNTAAYFAGSYALLDHQYHSWMGAFTFALALAGWIAFGKGERHFSTTISLPFLTRHGIGGDSMGRAIFGLGAIMVGAFTVVLTVVSVRRLIAARRDQR
jgi:hypothetical protein